MSGLSGRGHALSIAAGIVWMAALAAVLIAPYLTYSPTLGEDLTRNTVRLSLAYYAVAASIMLLRPLREKDAFSAERALARWCWTLAWAAFLVHLVMAMEYYDHWSHARAIRRTHAATGFGEGIYISHGFTLLWGADVAWWWLWPPRHVRRPRWITWTLHGLMGFVIFCGMVVYETGPIRWAGVGLFTWLGFLVARRAWCRWKETRIRSGLLVPSPLVGED